MNVINLSLGEPEVEPSRDIVVQAIDGAAAAGVVPVVAAGNDFNDFGYGSVSSPGNAPDAITVAAVSAHDVDRGLLVGRPDADLAADEARRLGARRERPLVAAGEPGHVGPPERHEHGHAARRRRGRAPEGAPPDWTVAQIKSALEQTGDPVQRPSGAEVPRRAARAAG